MKQPHLFLDMDGVQADFFGAWADFNRVESYRDIKDPEASIDQLAATGPDSVEAFFRKLKPLSGGQRIITWLKHHSIPFTVLSAPLRGEPDAAIRGKQAWLDEYNPGTSSNAIFTSKKHLYAMQFGTPQVLVDDFGKYIDAWSQAGGIAVKHDDSTTSTTIATLEQIYLPYLKSDK